MSNQEAKGVRGLKRGTGGGSAAHWGLLSDYRDVLYGIAIVCIVVFHLYESTLKGTAVHAVLWPFNRFSAGVDAFLFLSSIGLYFAFSGNNSIGRFCRRRFLRIVPTFLVVAIPFYLWHDLVAMPSIRSFIEHLTNLSFLTDGYRQFWYVYAILLFYVLYPLLHGAIAGSKRPLACTVAIIAGSFVLTAVFGMCLPDVLSNTEIMLTRFPVFVAGVYAGKLVKERVAMTGRQVLALAAIAAVFWVLSHTDMLKFGDSNIARRYFYSCAAVLLCELVPVLLAAFGCARDQRALSFLGRISLEMYIVNVAARTVIEWYCGDYFFGTASNLVQLEYCLLVVAATFGGAYVLHRLMGPVTRKLLG